MQRWLSACSQYCPCQVRMQAEWNPRWPHGSAFRASPRSNGTMHTAQSSGSSRVCGSDAKEDPAAASAAAASASAAAAADAAAEVVEQQGCQARRELGRECQHGLERATLRVPAVRYQVQHPMWVPGPGPCHGSLPQLKY